MAASWLPVAIGANGMIQSDSNWVTQKSVAVIPEDTIFWDVGTLLVMVTDWDSVTALVYRKFYYRRPGESSFTQFGTSWNPEGVGVVTKAETSSFVVAKAQDGHIYLHAVTSQRMSGTVYRLYYGRMKITEGVETWSNTILYATSINDDEVMYPDIAIDTTGEKIVVVWNGTTGEGMVSKQYQCSSINHGLGWMPVFRNTIDTTGYAPTILHDSGDYFWLHCGSPSTGGTTLHRGIYAENIGEVLGQCFPNMPNACISSNGTGATGVGLLDVDSNLDLNFKWWDGQTLQSDNVLHDNLGAGMNANNYGLCWRDGFWHALYYAEPTGEDARLYHQQKPTFNLNAWVFPSPQPQQESNYPTDVQLDHLGAHVVPNPAGIENPEFYALLAISQDANAQSKYNVWCRLEGEPTLPPGAVGNYWTGGYVVDGRNLDVSTETLAMNLRGTEA